MSGLGWMKRLRWPVARATHDATVTGLTARVRAFEQADREWDATHRTCGCGAIVTIWRTDADGVVRCVRCASAA